MTTSSTVAWTAAPDGRSTGGTDRDMRPEVWFDGGDPVFPLTGVAAVAAGLPGPRWVGGAGRRAGARSRWRPAHAHHAPRRPKVPRAMVVDDLPGKAGSPGCGSASQAVGLSPWRRRRELNPRHLAQETSALPTELRLRTTHLLQDNTVNGLTQRAARPSPGSGLRSRTEDDDGAIHHVTMMIGTMYIPMVNAQRAETTRECVGLAETKTPPGARWLPGARREPQGEQRLRGGTPGGIHHRQKHVQGRDREDPIPARAGAGVQVVVGGAGAHAASRQGNAGCSGRSVCWERWRSIRSC